MKIEDSCISFDSYIKPQQRNFEEMSALGCISFDSYIKPQPATMNAASDESCISFDSYIKPQLSVTISMALISCISFDSYIKPQQSRADSNFPSVVYLLIPTSNHNSQIERKPMSELYIF